MRSLFSILIFCVLFSACKSEEKVQVKRDGYILEGNAPGVYNGLRAYLEITNDKGRKIPMDTAIVMNGKFTFEGKVDYAEMVYLKINSISNSVPLIIENEAMTIDFDKDNVLGSVVKGTPANDALNLYNVKTGELKDKRFAIGRELRSTTKNDATQDNTDRQKELDAIAKEMEDYPFQFVEEHKDNIFSVILLQKLSEVKKSDLDRIETALNSLSPEMQNSIPANILKSKMKIKKAEMAATQATEIGQTAPAFTAPSPDGEMIALNDIKGKLTLIDFWASWCKPCRRENPNVVKVYNKYHDKGLEIISVSLDGTRSQKDPKAAWLKAIEDDNLTWNHVSNLQYFNDPVARSYNIRSIPATFLLDENGKILAKNLRGPALEQAVAKHLN